MRTGPPSDSEAPPLSVVVGARGPEESLAACLSSLEAQRRGAEVIVCESRASSDGLRTRFDWARFVECEGELVPHLWREGIMRSRGRIVALTNSTMIVADDWIACIEAEHRDHDVVAGAIEPAPGLRMSDWAEYFCRYSPDMLPFEGRVTTDLPGDNASYKQQLLASARELYRDGFWEPAIHRRFEADGARLWHSPALVVRQGRSSGVRAFALQRLSHGRAHGAERAAELSRAENVARVLAAPVVAVVLSARVGRRVVSRRRHRLRFLATVPLILLFNAAWAAGEAAGHARRLRGG